MGMEHRWAERHTVDIAVRLRGTRGTSVIGQMVNISKNGAFILTAPDVPFVGRIDILISDDAVQAYVMREAAGGVGVEWLEWLGTGDSPNKHQRAVADIWPTTLAQTTAQGARLAIVDSLRIPIKKHKRESSILAHGSSADKIRCHQIGANTRKWESPAAPAQ